MRHRSLRRASRRHRRSPHRCPAASPAAGARRSGPRRGGRGRRAWRLCSPTSSRSCRRGQALCRRRCALPPSRFWHCACRSPRTCRLPISSWPSPARACCSSRALAAEGRRPVQSPHVLPEEAPAPAADLKAALIVFRQVLKAWANETAPASPVSCAFVACAAVGSRPGGAGADAACGNDQRPATRQRARRRGRDACHECHCRPSRRPAWPGPSRRR